jgi:glycosyltransferase involved in cell wall biosynthesis
VRIALVVPGGVDRSGEYRVIPALLALIGRLSLHNEVHVFALVQEATAGDWELAGAHIHNIGVRPTHLRAIRAIWKMHRASAFDVIHAIWSGKCGFVAAVAGRLLGVPNLVHVAGGELVSIPEIDYGGARTWTGRLRESLVLRAVCAVTAASEPTITALSLIGIAAERVPLGVDLMSWPPRAPVRRDRARPARLVHVASLNRIKDQATLLRALAELMRAGLSFEMDVVGEDILNGEVQSLSERLGLSTVVRFHGFLTQRQMRPLLEAAHIMVISSRHETGPLAVLEAAVVGVPTAGTRVGHIAEWEPHAALSAPIGDWLRLAGTIRRLMEDEDLRLGIASEAHRRAIHEDAVFTAERFHALYARCSRSRPSPA